jgi:hypothetical protein
MFTIMSEAGWISLANTCATFILSIFILWTRWSLNKYELRMRDQHGIEVVKLDEIRRDIKEGTIAKHVAELVADKVRDELSTTLAEAMALMSQIQLKTPPKQGP